MNTTRLTPGTPVYDVNGDPENPDDLGTIHSMQEGGYAVVWTGDITPKFAAEDEVAAVPADEPKPSGFPPFAVRAGSGHLTAWVGSDNIAALSDHVEAIVKGKDSTRRLTIISRYRHGNDTGEDKGLVGTSCKTGLTLDRDVDPAYGPIERRTQARPAGQSITFHLTPGIEAFGFSAYDNDGTEEDQRARYWAYDPTDVFSARRNIVKVVIDGWPGSPSRNDKIQIEHWNDHGVCKDTIILFDDIWDEDR